MDEAARRILLKTARKAVEAAVRGESPPVLPDDRPGGIPFTGIFVTLKNRERLRGCIGTFRPLGDILETVSEIAVSSTRDPRFVTMPIRPKELKELTIEVSVLGALRRTDDPLSLKLGTDGIYVRRGGRAGCFLPQVATEQGWTREQFLDRCCEGKAGLPAESWKEPETEVYLFTTEVFGEGNGLEQVAEPENSSAGEP
jgi:uncharacterized protein